MFDSQTYTLPNGINIFFTDSGAPPNSDDYTTVVVLHGSAFNGSTFDKIHDYAHKYNIRAVVWNRRDYRGSTELTDAEIDDLNKGKKSFLDMLAAQMADFLKLLIEKEKIPRVQNNAGGIALMGWSMGAASTMPFFADPAVIKPEIYEILEPYVKNLILLDPPATAIGYQEISTQKIYDPWYDPEYKTPAEQFQNFCSWVSSYYEHPDLESYPPVFNEHKGDMTNATITKWSKEEFGKFYDEKAAVRSEYGMRVPPMQYTLKDIFRRILFDEATVSTFFPKVTVLYIGATHTIWHCALGTAEAKNEYERHLAEGRRPRKVKFVKAEGCNHFLQWDHPEQLVELIATGMKTAGSV